MTIAMRTGRGVCEAAIQLPPLESAKIVGKDKPSIYIERCVGEAMRIARAMTGQSLSRIKVAALQKIMPANLDQYNSILRACTSVYNHYKPK